MLEQLKALDTSLFLYLNGKHNAFFDFVMYWASDKVFWIPFYVLIALLLVKEYKRRSIFIFVGVAVLIAISDQLSSGLIKPWVGRLRPSHNPAIEHLVHLSKAGAGGLYGFVSSHAANSFALFTFLSIVLDRKFNWLKIILFSWALLTSYSRIYVGVHYPGDVLCGAVLGIIIGILFSIFFRWTLRFSNAFIK